ncbi:MAG: methyltransferase domain-containing protein [Candidatus Nealsonbacteria bacterium]|nr:methyltransferase domain-containing protein [Candidatus Nealsonbacteria bacterium]
MEEHISKGRVRKWEERNKRYESGEKSVQPTRKATFVLTVKNILDLLGELERGKLLDIGCGFGEIDLLLAQYTDFEITGCDISETALDNARQNVKKAGLESEIKIEKADVYNFHYPDNHFDVILSTGYVSAATYPGVQKEVARVLKPGGILVCDFINHLSLYKILKAGIRILKTGEIPSYLSLGRICRAFKEYGLACKDQRIFNTYPPLNIIFSSENYLNFEKTFGKILSPVLGRVRLVKFEKVKK